MEEEKLNTLEFPLCGSLKHEEQLTKLHLLLLLQNRLGDRLTIHQGMTTILNSPTMKKKRKQLMSETFNHFLVDMFIIGKATTARMNC